MDETFEIDDQEPNQIQKPEQSDWDEEDEENYEGGDG